MSWDWTPESRARLGRFLEERGLCEREVTTRRIGDGHSNLTFLVSDGTRQLVVRRPPPPPTPPGAHDMLREARLLLALEETEVPVPRVLATAEAGELLDVGCYVMSYVEGPVVTTAMPTPLDAAVPRRQVGEALVDTLAALHAVDWRAAGVHGRPEGFNRRHLANLGRLVADGDGRPPAEFTMIDTWLADNVPDESGDAIVHNDFRIGNVVLSPEAPGRVAAVLDWELATVGDPLFDVGYFLASVPEPGRDLTPTEELATAMLADGWPTRAELAARYADRTGRDLAHLDWHTTLALWKLAVLYEYGRRRAASGEGDSYYAGAGKVRSFLAAAHRAAGLDPVPEASR
jgi:aminoglycoside phosphotransferase (APT) family kinase protein